MRKKENLASQVTFELEHMTFDREVYNCLKNIVMGETGKYLLTGISKDVYCARSDEYCPLQLESDLSSLSNCLAFSYWANARTKHPNHKEREEYWTGKQK